MVAFTADNHLGVTSQWSIKERKTDFLQAFHNVVESIGNMKGTDKSLIIGGDLFDTAYPPSFAVEFVQNEVRRLESVYGCRVYGIDGNHDIADGKWLRVCGITPLCSDPVVVDPETGATACGISYRRAADVLSELSSMVDRNVKCDILVLHLALGEMNRMGAASDVTAEEMKPMLDSLGVSIVLIGHIHIRQVMEIGGITYIYSGSTEMCSMSEPDVKSFELIDTREKKTELVEIMTREIKMKVIRDEKDLAKYADSLVKDDQSLHAVYVSRELADGVKRVRSLMSENGILSRIQVIQEPSEGKDEQAIDRTTGVIGLEQAICLKFRPDSEEADLIRSILRSPASLKLIVDNYMKEELNDTVRA